MTRLPGAKRSLRRQAAAGAELRRSMSCALARWAERVPGIVGARALLCQIEPEIKGEFEA